MLTRLYQQQATENTENYFDMRHILNDLRQIKNHKQKLSLKPFNRNLRPAENTTTL